MSQTLFAALFLLAFSAESYGARRPVSRLYLRECTILNSDFEPIRVLPGYYCAVRKDGSWVASGKNGLTSYSPSGDELWNLPGSYHHQVEIDEDGSILTLAKGRVSIAGISVSEDHVLKVSADGKIVKSFSVADSIVDLEKIDLRTRRVRSKQLWLIDYALRQTFGNENIDSEISHLNAVYRIPKSQRAATNSGEYLITDALLSACLALDENFKLTGWAYRPPPQSELFIAPTIHDCQLLPDGSVLYFENSSAVQAKPTYRVLRMLQEKPLFIFPTKAVDFIDARTRGSVEAVPEGYLISAVSESAREGILGVVSPRGEWLSLRPDPRVSQEIKVLPHKEFLNKNDIR